MPNVPPSAPAVNSPAEPAPPPARRPRSIACCPECRSPLFYNRRKTVLQCSAYPACSRVIRVATGRLHDATPYPQSFRRLAQIRRARQIDTLTLPAFVRDHCAGPQYDSCVGSPCRYASGDGCQHPLHPKRQQAIAKTEESDHHTRTTNAPIL